jgi:hypothetical protein
MGERATFTRMEDSTAEDWRRIAGEYGPFVKALPRRIVAHLKLLEGDYGGFPVDRCATAATRNTWSARCCTTSATRSAPSTTSTSPRRS